MMCISRPVNNHKSYHVNATGFCCRSRHSRRSLEDETFVVHVEQTIVPYRFVKVRLDELEDMINHREFVVALQLKAQRRMHSAVCLFPIGERRPSPHTSIEAHERVLAKALRAGPLSCLNASNFVRLISSPLLLGHVPVSEHRSQASAECRRQSSISR